MTRIDISLSLINQPVPAFALAQLRALLRNRRVLLSSVLTPVFMLLLFWLVARSSSDAQIVAQYMFPAIVGFSVMMAGGVQATRLVTWRQNRVFQRLAVTPVPVGYLVLGDALTQVLMSVGQGMVTLLVGVVLLRLPVSAEGTAVAVGALLLAGACFIAYGSFIATLVRRPESANLLFVFSMLPMFFLGGGFPPGVLPPAVAQAGTWLPFTAANNLIQPLLTTGIVPASWLRDCLLLLGYTGLFSLVAARFFRWE